MTDRRPRTKTRAAAKGTSERPEAIRIRLLGGFEVTVGARTIEEAAWRLRKATSIVKLLALAPGHRLHREQIMDALWPDLGMQAASNNLRQTLYSVRRSLDPATGPSYLGSQDKSIVLCPGRDLWVDAEAFEEAARTARRLRRPAAYEAAIDLYAGELLPTDRYEEWAEEPRRRLQERYLSLLLGLAHLHEELVDYDSAIEALRRIVLEEPTREEAYAGLMRVYALAGNNKEALAQYGRLEETLSRELGTEPSASSRALREEITAGRFPPTERQSLTSQSEEPPDAGKHNLPATRSSFVGRETELQNLKRDLAMTRLLTLTGTGGCGKTRLALEVARELIGAYPDGVWLVELAPLSEGALVAHAVAAALGVQEQPERSRTDVLVDYLGAKRALLVLDNCEHLIDPVARLTDDLLNSCSHIKLLATSRESLNVEGELNWLVPSLSAPRLLQPPTVGQLAGYESVRLFVERARHRNPEFSLTPENAHAVARICERLDGIPLAIELAAGRVGLSVEQIATRLDDCLRLLTAGSRTASPRQRTLRGTLDWSYALLSESERRLFGRTSVFAGGWTLQGAEVVEAGDAEQGDVLDLLSKLVEKSLVVAVTTGGGGVRYRLLEPVRQYAQEKLEENDEGEKVRRRHASFCLALAEEAEPRLRGPEDVEWLERLEAEHDNMRAALSWAMEQRDAELALQLAGALQPFWETHGHFSEGRRWLEKAWQMKGPASVAVRAKVLYGVSQMANLQNDTARAEAAAQEGLKLSAAEEIEDSLTALFRWMLGYTARIQGDYERARNLLEENLASSRGADDKPGMVDALLELGSISRCLGDHERAKQLYEEGIVLCREVGFGLRLGDLLLSLGYTLILEGDYERGAALNEEAAALYRNRGYKGGLQWALNNLGWAALFQGDHERARSYFDDSLTLCIELGDKMFAAECLVGLACISAAEGEGERAAKLFGAAEALRQELGYQHLPGEDASREPYYAATRSQLADATWNAMWAEGEAMSMEQAVGYALAHKGPASRAPERSSAFEQPDLTSREREVAILVARGLTNRQIASELVISVHTVHHHVTNILKKLNLSSRLQVASHLPDR